MPLLRPAFRPALVVPLLVNSCGGAKPSETPNSAASPGAPVASSALPSAPARPAPASNEARLRGAVPLIVKNGLPSPRASETIVVRLGELKPLAPAMKIAELGVQDAKGALLLSQLVDSDGDGQPDQLVFKTDLAPNESKAFLVGEAARAVVSHDQYRVYGRFVRERHDDFAWENDRTAHRMYGPELETWPKEPLVSSGVDVWVKRTRRLVINEWYQTDDYHRDNGDGADFYSVGPSRGCGGVGVWDGKQLHVSRNFTRSKVLANGPIRLIFELEYAPWSVGPGVSVSETKRITVDGGYLFDEFQSTFTVKGSAKGLRLGVGIAKHAGGTFDVDAANGSLRSWEPLSDENGHLGCAVVATSNVGVGFAETPTERLLLMPLASGTPEAYLVGSSWDKGGDVADSAAWAAKVSALAAEARSAVQVVLGGEPTKP